MLSGVYRNCWQPVTWRSLSPSCLSRMRYAGETMLKKNCQAMRALADQRQKMKCYFRAGCTKFIMCSFQWSKQLLVPTPLVGFWHFRSRSRWQKPNQRHPQQLGTGMQYSSVSYTSKSTQSKRKRKGKRNKDLQIRGLKNLGSICMLSRRVKLVHLSFKRFLPNHEVEK